MRRRVRDKNFAASSASTKPSTASRFMFVLRRFNTREHNATEVIRRNRVRVRNPIRSVDGPASCRMDTDYARPVTHNSHACQVPIQFSATGTAQRVLGQNAPPVQPAAKAA